MCLLFFQVEICNASNLQKGIKHSYNIHSFIYKVLCCFQPWIKKFLWAVCGCWCRETCNWWVVRQVTMSAWVSQLYCKPQPRFMEHYKRGDRKSVKVGTVESCGELLSGMKGPMQVWMPVKDLTYIQAARGSTWRGKAFQGLTLSWGA